MGRQFDMHISHHTAAVLIIGLIIFAAFCWWADKMRDEYENCPRLILGYPSCNLWYGKRCDHSDKAVQRAQAARRDW